MRVFALLAALFAALILVACATAVPYSPAPFSQNPRKVLERVLSEQPTIETPEVVRVTEDFFEYTNGTVTEGSRWTRSQTTRTTTARVFYKSIAEVKLYQKRGIWYVVPESKQGPELAIVSASNEADAKQLIDALVLLRGQAAQ